MTNTQAAGLTIGRGPATGPTFFKIWMPYLFQRIAHPKRKHAFLPLNRDYAPLGLRRGEHRDYSAMMATHGVVFSRDPADLDVWWNKRGDQLWLYDDNRNSRIDYFARLERLMAHQVEMIG